MRLTHIGGPTALIELGGWTLLTDPTFDAPAATTASAGGRAPTSSPGPAIAAAELPPLDAVLLSHDHHEDNLDPAGRALLPAAGEVITTASGAKRLGFGRGLVAWEGTRSRRRASRRWRSSPPRAGTARRSRTRSSAT